MSGPEPNSEQPDQVPDANKDQPEDGLPRPRQIPVFDEKAINDPVWFFSSLVDSLPVNVVCKNSDGEFIYVNQAFSTLMKLPANEFMGKTDFDLTTQERAHKYRADDSSVMGSGAVFREIETISNTPIDKLNYFEVRKSPLVSREGDIVGIEAVFWEVSALKQAEAKAKHERFLLDSLMNNIPDSIYFKDLKSRFTRVSSGLAEKFNLQTASELKGKTDADLFSEEHAQLARKDELEIIETKKPVLNKVEKETWPDGSVTWCSSTKMALLDTAGSVVGTFGISRDITELVKTQEELRKAKISADAANQAKSDFLANMSHEIRTPMNAVLGITELLLDTELSTQQREYLNMVLSSAESLLNLINDILDFSKIEAGKLDLSPAPFDLRSALGDTLRVLGMRAQAKNLELAFSVAPKIPTYLLGDVGRLRQVVVNLVGNAIKFTEEGEIVVEVERLSANNDQIEIQIKVRDTGIGIPKSKLDLIFREFEQADSSTTRVYGGSGLGLAIASKLVGLMNGEISVESEVGKGSTFTFNSVLEVIDETSSVSLGDSKGIQNARILIIDENVTNRMIINDMISNWGMQSFATANLEEASQLLSDHSIPAFSAVLADSNLLTASPLEFAKRINDLEESATRLPIILLTGTQIDERTQEFLRQDDVYQVIKPAKQSAVFESIMGALKFELESAVGVNEGTIVEADRQLNVLLVEDNVVNQKLAIGLLSKQCHHVVVAENGKVAIEEWEKNPFDLILMDVQMPVMDGFSATKEIRRRELESGDHIPIIAMTARAMASDKKECFEAGMDDYLSKPIRIKHLTERIKKVCFDLGSVSPPSNQRSEMDKLVDWTLAKENVGGDQDLLKSLIEILLEDTPAALDKLEQSVAAGELANAESHAHAIKGSVMFLGSPTIETLAALTEQAAKDGNLESVQEHTMGLRALWIDLANELNVFMS